MTHKTLNKHTQKLYIEVLLDQLQQKLLVTDLTNMEESLLHQQDLQKILTHQKFQLSSSDPDRMMLIHL